MSNAGRGKRNQPPVPGIRRNGPNALQIPDDIVWTDDEPIILFACTQHTFHHPQCDGNCESIVATESQVKLRNEGLAFARAGMSFKGVPASYEGVPLPPGIPIEIFDLWLKCDLLQEIVLELSGMSLEELDERFREKKYEFLHNVRLANEDRIRKARVANSLGIVEGPGLLGPDGRPLK